MSNSEKIEDMEKQLQAVTKELEETQVKLKAAPVVVQAPTSPTKAAQSTVSAEVVVAAERKFNELLEEKKRIEEQYRNQVILEA